MSQAEAERILSQRNERNKRRDDNLSRNLENTFGSPNRKRRRGASTSSSSSSSPSSSSSSDSPSARTLSRNNTRPNTQTHRARKRRCPEQRNDDDETLDERHARLTDINDDVPPLSQTMLLQLTNELNPSDIVRITWYSDYTTWVGTVKRRTATGVEVDCGVNGHISLPPPESMKVMYLFKTQYPPDIPFAIESTRPILNRPDVVTFAAGGMLGGSEVGAAAIHLTPWNLQLFCNDRPETHARFYAKSSSILCQAAALLAALRKARHMNSTTIIFISDKFLLDTLVARKKSRRMREETLNRELWQAWDAVSSFTIVALLAANQPNLAVPVVNSARQSAISTKDSNLIFPDLSNLPSTRPIPFGRTEVDATEISAIARKFTSTETFIRLRRFKCRSRCPDNITHLWAQAVKLTLSKIVQATTIDDRSTAVFELLVLPAAYLPLRCSTTRLENHLASNRPFNISPGAAPTDTQPNTDGATNASVAVAAVAPQLQRTEDEMRRTREGRLMTSLALDRKIRSCVKVMQRTDTRIDYLTLTNMATAKFGSAETAVRAVPAAAIIPFSVESVKRALGKINHNAATCIDGWTRSLLQQAAAVDESILSDVAALLKMITEGGLTRECMECLRMGRMIPLPKDDGGVRPVVLTSFFVKLAGLTILKHTAPRLSQLQYAINTDRGAECVVHEVRHDYLKKRFVAKFDIENAFNAVDRNRIADALVATKAAPEIMSYWNALYVAPTPIVTYTGGAEMRFHMTQGVRQGDALSAFLFCLLMDVILTRVKARMPSIDMWCYMDDITITGSPADAALAIRTTIEEIHNCGLRVNTAKSRCIHALDADLRADIPQIPAADFFAVLGSSITFNHELGIEKLQKRMTTFAQRLVNADVHMQLKWTILRLCGAPKMLYFASTVPPDQSKMLLEWFDHLVHHLATTILGANVEPTMLHHVYGGGFPQYAKQAQMLYDDSVQCRKQSAMQKRTMRHQEGARLVPNGFNSTAAALSQQEAHYLFYSAGSELTRLGEREFQLALCLRLRTLPLHEQHPTACPCGHSMPHTLEFLDHIFRCDAASPFTRVHRHNILRDSIIQIANRFGITTTKEPTFFAYADGILRRPDIAFHTARKIATDVTIVLPQFKEGQATAEAARLKNQIHHEPCAAIGYEFIPFAVELFGQRGACCFALEKALAQHIPRHLLYPWKCTFETMVSCAIARGRALTIDAAVKGHIRHLEATGHPTL